MTHSPRCLNSSLIIVPVLLNKDSDSVASSSAWEYFLTSVVLISQGFWVFSKSSHSKRDVQSSSLISKWLWNWKVKSTHFLQESTAKVWPGVQLGWAQSTRVYQHACNSVNFKMHNCCRSLRNFTHDLDLIEEEILGKSDFVGRCQGSRWAWHIIALPVNLPRPKRVDLLGLGCWVLSGRSSESSTMLIGLGR